MAFADDGVVVLDPACGTATYPIAVIEDAVDTVRARLGPGAVPERLRDLAARLHAFEVLVGPYSVAHLRVSQRLREFGVADRTPSIYLTDTLESPHALPEFTASLLQESLTEERRRAQRVKNETRVFVCLGNPPYDLEQRELDEGDTGRRKGGWVRYGDEIPDAAPPIFDDFLAPVREAGGGVHLRFLYNDYVYFWRWALWKVFDSTGDDGIVTFITASSYLRGPAFAGMRRKMREVFDELWIIDLEGDSIGARKTENIFSIRIPVAIAIGIRQGQPEPETPARVWKVRLTGSASEKLEAINTRKTLSEFDWRECATDWDAPFFGGGDSAYFEWPSVMDVFPWQLAGPMLHRTWPIDVTRDVLAAKWSDLLSRDLPDRSTAFGPTRDRDINSRVRDLFGDTVQTPLAELGPAQPPPPIAEYAFRSFDREFVLLDARLGD